MKADTATKRADVTALWVWLALCGLTIATWMVGRAGLGGAAVVAALMLSVLVKGQMVVDFYMGLRRVRGPWRWVVTGWLVAVLSLIGVAYWLGAH
ncbi:MAG TPA: hypothetical protein ENK12_04040 [Gammaproteobacteria bacterium]|nr:hypothetical protein [Gammaproteobacteria bacterium]